MRSKVTVVLLFLNVVLFYYIFHFERVKPLDANGKRVFGSEVASIDSLTRRGPNTPTVHAMLDPTKGNTWWLTEPYAWPANPNAIAGMLNELQFLEHETSFPVADLAKSDQTLANFGLDQPALTLTFTSALKTYVVKIGDRTEMSNRLYLLSSDGTRIHVVNRSLADSIGLPLEALRSESIFTVPVFEVRSLNVQTSNLKVRLRRDPAARWAFESPIKARASKSAVEVTINALNALTAKTFLEAAGTDLERTGLNSPTLRVTLEGNARRETLLFGSAVVPAPTVAGSAPTPPSAGSASAASPEYYAKIEDKAVVFTVPIPQPLLDVLRSAQETLRDPHVLDFESNTVTALTLTTPDRPELTLQRLEAGINAATWQVVVRNSGQAPQTITADTAVVDELLQKIHLLSATEFLSDAPSADDLEKYGFNRPERTITLSLKTGGGPSGADPSTLTLQIGVSPSEKGKAFARVTNVPFVYQIAPNLLEAAPVQPLHYRQRQLRELPAGAKIQGITLTDANTNELIFSKQLTETKSTWDQVVAEETEGRRKAIGMALTQLHTLRAKRFTVDTFTPAQADTPQGPQPWKYRLDVNISFAGGTEATQNSTSTLLLTERFGGNSQLAGTGEFGGVVFEATQELIDALFTLTYREKNDPGPAVSPPVAESPEPKTAAPVKEEE